MSNDIESDVVEHTTIQSFESLLDRLKASIDRAGLTIFATIDHAAAAKAVDLVMPPTLVLIYGNAKGGTPIMLAAPRVALDLPLRVLVWERADGFASFAFHRAAHMLEQAGLPAALTTRLDPAQHILLEALSS